HQLQEILQVADTCLQLGSRRPLTGTRLRDQVIDLLEEVAEDVADVVDDLGPDDDHLAVTVWHRDPTGLALCNPRHVYAPHCAFHYSTSYPDRRQPAHRSPTTLLRLPPQPPPLRDWKLRSSITLLRCFQSVTRPSKLFQANSA